MSKLKSDTFLFAMFSFMLSFSQNDSKEDLKIFLDCDVCDTNFIKQNLGNAQFVRDQNLGDVHLFFLTQGTGSGGRLYEIDFIGKNSFKDINYKISFNTDTNMTSDDIRNRILEYIKLGLVRYWIANNTYGEVTVDVPNPELDSDLGNEEIEDPWDYWVFRVGANGRINGQETNKSSNVNLNISAQRVTEENKFSFRAGFGENQSTFTFDEEDIVNINSSKYLNISDVISINNHWSYGVFGNMGSSTYSNRDLYWSVKPAIEYDFFEYKDSAKKQLTLSYRNGIVFNKYIELTVYDQTQEYLWEHNLVLGGSVRQEWGNIYSEASFNQYLQDTTLNALRFYLGANVRIFKGFNFNIGGSYSIISNQINLPAGDVSLEELLLQQQQLQSNYNYRMNVGLSYSFGSIYNTIVNPRFNF